MGAANERWSLAQHEADFRGAIVLGLVRKGEVSHLLALTPIFCTWLAVASPLAVGIDGITATWHRQVFVEDTYNQWLRK